MITIALIHIHKEICAKTSRINICCSGVVLTLCGASTFGILFNKNVRRQLEVINNAESMMMRVEDRRCFHGYIFDTFKDFLRSNFDF